MHFLPLLLTVALAAEPNHIAEKITLKEVEFDSLAEVLHIRGNGGTLTLTAPRRKGTIEIEPYKDGNKQPLLLGPGIKSEESGDIRFSVQVIDLDYLSLGSGKKGHCRVHSKLSIGSHYGASAQDISKDFCDFSTMASGGSFGPKASTEDRVPLFWMIGNTNTVATGSTPDEIVKKNPKGDLAIVYVRLSEWAEESGR